MVLYKIESQDQSVDIFIKIGKVNVTNHPPTSLAHVCMRFEFCNYVF